MTTIDQTTPATLADSLGLTLYPWQRCALDKVQYKASISTPSAAGKDTRIITPLALWWVSVYPKGKVVILSDQCETQTLPSISDHKDRFPKFRFDGICQCAHRSDEERFIFAAHVAWMRRQQFRTIPSFYRHFENPL